MLLLNELEFTAQLSARNQIVVQHFIKELQSIGERRERPSHLIFPRSTEQLSCSFNFRGYL